jgi:hypothetical protein
LEPSEVDVSSRQRLVVWLAFGFCFCPVVTWAGEPVTTPTSQRLLPVWRVLLLAYPGYDDAAKNMPLPAGRNRLAAQEILQTGRVGCVAGFSSDLLILQANSENPAHDGRQASFYETLKRGEPYRGFYAVPFQEIMDIYNGLNDGKSPGRD